MKNKYLPSLHKLVKGHKFANDEKGKSLVQEVLLQKKLVRPRKPMRTFIDEKNFIHLHLHSEFSLLDGATRIESLVKKAKDMGMRAVAVTDHGNMYGAVTFFDACVALDEAYYKQFGKPVVKPIFGCEFYVSKDYRRKEGREKLNHLILLVKNEKGYQNISKLNAIAFRDGFYFKPRIDFDLLEKYSEGLICLSACVAGNIPQLLIEDRDDEAEELAIRLKKMFAEGDFYIEVQDHGLRDEKYVLPKLYKLAKKIGVKTVATNDVHYLLKRKVWLQLLKLWISATTTLFMVTIFFRAIFLKMAMTQ